MKNNNYSVYLMMFVYAFFSYAVSIPEKSYNLQHWILLIFLIGLVNVFIVFVASNNRETALFTNIVITAYILMHIVIVINKMDRYMKVYHRNYSGKAFLTVTFFTVIILYSFDIKKLEKLAVPLGWLVLITIPMILILNFTKANPGNLYMARIEFSMDKSSVTMFDWSLPVCLLLKRNHQCNRKKMFFTVSWVVLVLILITVFIFSCIKGNLMYSISPLQMAFQISSGNQIANFDVYYTCLLWFGYFTALILLVSVFHSFRVNIFGLKGAELLLIMPLLLAEDKAITFLWLILFIITVVLLGFTGRKEVNYEKV